MRSLPILTVLLLTACTGEKPDVIDTGIAAEVDTPDADADGYDASEDCDDANSVVNPGAAEICDGVDNNCDGVVDESVTTTFYADTDGDGFGDSEAPTEACEQPAGYVPIGNDCDDTNEEVYPSAPERCDGLDNNCNGEIDEDLTEFWYADADGDGSGDPDAGIETCDPKQGYVEAGDDCDDTDPTAFPGGEEVCDESDNDCDGTVDEGVTTTYYEDVDADGYGLSDTTAESCDLPTGYAEEAGDCNDGDAAISPDAEEVCDGVDNDCDGITDEDDASDAVTWYEDDDGDGYGDATDATLACNQPSGHVASDTDCDDSDSAINPGATEVCDGDDNDCDGTTDEDDADDALTWYEDDDGDGYGDANDATLACDQPSGHVSDDTDCDDADSNNHPGADEYCDGDDNDCDGTIDEDDAVDTESWFADDDGDGFGDPDSTTDACDAPSGHVADNTDCDDAESTTNPDAAEVCDEIDNDCDGDIDEGAANPTTWYADDDSDGYGDPDITTENCGAPSGYVSNDEDCDDGNNTISPDGTEVCNGEDDDCDGDIDEDVADMETFYADDDGDGFGNPDDTTEDCEAPSGFVEDDTDCDDAESTTNPDATEVCDGDDNDCDGVDDNGVLGTGTACPAEDCTEILADDSTASDGDYELDLGTYTCDMTTDGGGWTLVGDAMSVYGTGYDTTYYNSEGFSWSEALFVYNSGTVHAHCSYPSDMTGCNNLGFQFASESWGVPLNWGSSICGMSTTDYTGDTNYVGGYDFSIARSESTDTVRLGTLEGIASCTTSDNPGTAYVDILVRH
ncbi:MAG: hypothetical protein ACI8RZ_005626 [Myxococcota bacterium]|jgi:hypothetical protein